MDESVKCVIGKRNPDYFLSWESFCNKTLPIVLKESEEIVTETTTDEEDGETEETKEEPEK